jgi:class 3 adenylate cyclase/tetratricopeptide (TPR) repeat protein
MTEAAQSVVTRKLAAVLIGDIAGYSRLMERDEGDTHVRLRTIRDELVDPQVARNRGRIVKSAGDGILAVFGSATDALRCAIAIQRTLAERNREEPAARRIVYRFGLNIGDIIEDGNDIAGDGVNVAARLESLCQPGQICMSAAARDHVREKVDVEFVDLGPQRVKNIERIIHAYGVSVDGPYRAPAAWRRGLANHRRTVAAVGVLLVALCGAAAWWYVQNVRGTAPDLSIAVLPFSTRGSADDDAARRVAARVAQGIAVSHREALVLPPPAPEAAPVAKRSPRGTRQLGAELNVRYLIDGELRTAAEGFVLDAQLIDVDNGKLIVTHVEPLPRDWQSREGSDAIQRTSLKFARALFDAEQVRLSASSNSALALYMRALAVYDSDNDDTRAAEVRQLLDQSLAVNPRLIPALVTYGKTFDTEIVFADEDRAQQIVRQYGLLADRALAADRHDPRAWVIRAVSLMYAHQLDPAISAVEESLRLAPDYTNALFGYGLLLELSGRYDEALAYLDRAARVEPDGTNAWILTRQCEIYVMLGRYDAAVRACERVTAYGDWWFPQAMLTVAYAGNGDASKSQAARARVLAVNPGYSIAFHRRIQQRYSGSPAFIARQEKQIWEPLRAAGLPDSPAPAAQ